MRSAAARRLAGAGLLLVVGLGVAGAAAWSQRLALARWWLLRELARAGVAPAELRVERLDARRLELRDLRAGEGAALAIDAIDADYTLALLWRGRVGALRVSGVRLTGEIAAAGPRFGGLEALAGAAPETGEPAAAPTTALRLPALPSNQLRIEGARAEIATAQGPLVVELSVDASDTDGRIQARADAVARHALAEATAQLELGSAGGEEAVHGAAALGLRLAPGAGLGLPISAGSLALAAELEASGSQLSAVLSPGPFALVVGEGADALRFEGRTPPAQLSASFEADGALSPVRVLASGGGDLRIEPLGIALRGFELTASLDPPAYTGRLGVREIEDRRSPPRVPAFGLTGSFEPNDGVLAFELRAAAAKQQLVLHAQGSFDPEAGTGEAKLRVEPLHFAEGGLQPAALAPQLAAFFQSAVGTLEAAGVVRWSRGGPRLTLDVAARDLSLTTPLAQVQGVNGAVRIEGPKPFSTPPGQLISVARIGFGLELTDGLLAGRLRPDGSVSIEKAEWRVAGGRIFTSGDVDPKAAEQALVLEAQDLDLAQLLALVDLEGLSGEGRVDGRLPLTRRPDAILIRGGVIRARPGGWLRYRPSAGVAGVAQSAPGFDLLLGAFDNLNFEMLEVEIDGEATGEVKLALHVRGANPDFQDGRPIHYNLTVESRLADLLRQGKAVYEIPQVIEQRLERFGQRPRGKPPVE